MIELPWLDPEGPVLFPAVESALDDPPGLLAYGGHLTSEWLVTAYRSGIFPWYNPGEPILWWSPCPRMTLKPSELNVRRSLRKVLKKKQFQVTFDQAFEQVLEGCSAARSYTDDTWITKEMKTAYIELHKQGYAHSVEAWQDGQLVGGLYGVAIGKIFCGESMFTRVNDASKVAFVHLVEQLKAWQFELIDCQVYTEYLASFGAQEIERDEFLGYLKEYGAALELPGEWKISDSIKESIC
jgi:leucyl/phenylalanyl-tRNA--protein transferase